MSKVIHSCSYYCDSPECIKAQRDELVRNYIDAQAEWPSEEDVRRPALRSPEFDATSDPHKPEFIIGATSTKE